jgi:hypothetical protein
LYGDCGITNSSFGFALNVLQTHEKMKLRFGEFEFCGENVLKCVTKRASMVENGKTNTYLAESFICEVNDLTLTMEQMCLFIQLGR